MTEPLDTYDDDHGDYDWDYDEVDERAPAPKILWGRVISLIVFMLIAFFLGRASKGGGVDQATYDAAVAEQEQLAAENADLEQTNEELRQLIDNTGGEDPGEDTEGEEENEEGNEDGESDVTSGTEYTVKSGDTLGQIVKRERGCTIVENEDGDSASLVENVLDADTQQPIDPNAPISAGQVLLIPPIPTGYSCP